MKTKPLAIAAIGFLTPFAAFAQNLTAKEIVKKADDKMRGETSRSVMEMKIIRPKWMRTVSFKHWGKGYDYTLTLITSPVKDKGKSFLKRENDMWSWNPTINRMVKLPPSMMAQGWMGSDYTNDDMLKESVFVTEFTHNKVGEETIDGLSCHKIELIPKTEANVVWGKVIMWVSKEEFLQMKIEFYDEEDFLVKTHLGKDVKVMDGRKIPTTFEIIPEDKPSQKTVVTIKSIEFNIGLEDSFFTQQKMKTIQ